MEQAEQPASDHPQQTNGNGEASSSSAASAAAPPSLEDVARCSQCFSWVWILCSVHGGAHGEPAFQCMGVTWGTHTPAHGGTPWANALLPRMGAHMGQYHIGVPHARVNASLCMGERLLLKG